MSITLLTEAILEFGVWSAELGIRRAEESLVGQALVVLQVDGVVELESAPNFF